MFEARLQQGSVLKKLMDAIKDLVNEANLDCSAEGISMQAMDSSHVSLVALVCRREGFDHYRADRNISLGINLQSMSKVMKCAGNDDIITIKADDQGDNVTFIFESPKQHRLSHFSLKLMDIDSEHLGIPDTEYKCVVRMSSSEFQRIVREMAVMGDTVRIQTTKDGVKFTVNGDMGVGSIICKQNSSADDEEDNVHIKIEDEVALTFALRYLNFFTKATALSSQVTLKMSPDVPLVVEYKIENLGYVRYYLAPKIEEEENTSSQDSSSS